MAQSLRILLIADDPEVIRRIGHGLQRQDSGLIMIEGADTLATARRRLAAGTYDLALVDLALGPSDGLHLLSDLQEIAPDLPVVALAANGTGPDAAACLALGAQDRLAPEAMDSAGLLDRLHSATARAQASQRLRRRSNRIAASLGATGDLAWHYTHGEGEVWLAAANPVEWQLPAPECSESLDALRARTHPDDREMVLRQLEEAVTSDQPWQLDARFRVDGGAYRWCILRGRSQLDGRGGLQHASGVLSDAQRQQKRLREAEQGRRFLRAVFDSARLPHAIVDSSAVITDCNQAWVVLDEPACHAGSAFSPGRRFIDKPRDPGAFGDLDHAELVRGVRQVLGGVADQFSCEYGDAERRWRMTVTPLLNPGIAGAVICHEEVTEARRAESRRQAVLAALEGDFRGIGGPVFRIAPDFEVLAANEEATALGRAPVTGRDVLKVLPRADADAVGDALAAIAGGARAAVRDTRPVDGRVMRWLVGARGDAEGTAQGFIAHGVDVSDLAQPAAPAPAAAATVAEVAEPDGDAIALAEARERQVMLEQALAAVEAEREALRGALAAADAGREELAAELHAALADVEAEREELKAGLEQARREADEARGLADAVRRQAEEARVEAEDARRKEQKAQRESAKLADALRATRSEQSATLAALAAAEQVPHRLRAELGEVRQGLRARIDELLEGVFEPLLNDRGEDPQAGRSTRQKDEAS
jgi:DNA-binding response OmpR family regulator